MGNSCTRIKGKEVLNPMSHRDMIMNRELSPLLNITHQFNVNKKYETVSEVESDIFVGDGIKRTNAYKTTLTKEEMERKRFEFWDSRLEGHKRCWIALKQAISAQQESETLQILGEVGLKLVNKSIQITFDSDGYKYDLPIFCINEPIEYAQISSQDQHLNIYFEEKPIPFKLRVVGIEKDLSISCATSETIEEFKKQAMSELGKEWVQFRVFLAGREMMPYHQIGNYKLGPETIVQAFVSNVK